MTSLRTHATVGDRPRPGQGQPRAAGRAPPRRRLPRPGHRLPGRVAARRGHRGAPADDWRSSSPARYADLVPTDGANLAAARRAAPRRAAGRRRAGADRASTRTSRSPAAWPAARPTRPPPCWPATRCGASASPRDELARAGRRARAATSRSPCSAAPRSAPAAASSSPPCWPRGTYHWVFAISDDGPLHAGVYAECDRLRARAAPRARARGSAPMMTALRSGDAEALGAALTNDLSEAAFSLQPDLRECATPGSSTARSAASCPGRADRRVPHRRATRPRSTCRCRSRASGVAPRRPARQGPGPRGAGRARPAARA